ncbi:hypothetical protein [Brachybacterium tyrofermentans]|uniref:hypothetical protein n=1 Tax=Brachybacterium TaxID=43668 RepID=UPI003D19B4A1
MNAQGTEDSPKSTTPDPEQGDAGSSAPAPKSPTRRNILIGAGSLAAAGAIGWGAVQLGGGGDPGPGEGPAGPVEPRLVDRDFPATFPAELAEQDPVQLEASSLGTPFTQVSLQDVALLMGTDERERLVLTQHGATAQIQLVPLDGDSKPTVHDVEVGVNPGLALGGGVAWFVTREDGRVLSVGPDPEALRDFGSVSEEASSLYSPVLGPSGRVYGGSFPTGAVWRLDPESEEITLGPQIDGNEYVRSLALVEDRLFAGTGGVRPALYEIDPETLEPTATHDVPGIREGGSVSRLTVLPGGSLLVYRDEEDGGSDGVFFEPDSGAFGDELAPGASSRSVTPDPSGDGAFFVAGDSIHWINARTFEVGEAGTSPLNNPTAVVTLSSGIVAAVAPDPAGGNSVTLAPLSGDGDRLEFAIEPSAHDITAVISLGSLSSLAIGGYQANGVVVVDTEGNELSRTASDSGVQQVEGGIESGEGTFAVGSYGEGRVHSITVLPDETVLEASEVTDLGEVFQQARPVAWATMPGGLAVGTAPEQGRTGGVVQLLELSGDQLLSTGTIENPADGRSVVGIVAIDDTDIIITTSVRGGYGAADEATEAVVMRLTVPDGTKVWSTAVGVLDAYSPQIQNGKLFCATTDGLLVLDVESGELLNHTVFGEPADTAGYSSARIEPWQVQGRFLHVARGQLSMVDLVDGTVAPGSDGVGSPLTLLGDLLYAASGAELVEFVLPLDPDLASDAG